jgi:hypothetical protein
VLDPIYKTRKKIIWLPSGTDIGDTGEQLPKHGRALAPGQVSAEAEVRPGRAEADVRVGRAGDVEALRVLEDRLVTLSFVLPLPASQGTGIPCKLLLTPGHPAPVVPDLGPYPDSEQQRAQAREEGPDTVVTCCSTGRCQDSPIAAATMTTRHPDGPELTRRPAPAGHIQPHVAVPLFAPAPVGRPGRPPGAPAS